MDQVRTDLALEENERIQEEKQEETRGVRVEESYMEKEDIRITTVHIDTENAARQLGKPRGTYVTIEASSMSQPDEEGHREVSRQMADILKEMLPRTEEGKELSVLIAGLGNRNVTPDTCCVNSAVMPMRIRPLRLSAALCPGLWGRRGWRLLRSYRGS